jgi:hypothetical protein
MKRICAWCGKSLGTAEVPDNRPVTHGLCESCRKTAFTPDAGNDSQSKPGKDGAAHSADLDK